MPRMDGSRCCDGFAKRADFEKLPIIMLTGSKEIRDANTAYQLGATSFTVKAVDFDNATEEKIGNGEKSLPQVIDYQLCNFWFFAIRSIVSHILSCPARLTGPYCKQVRPWANFIV